MSSAEHPLVAFASVGSGAIDRNRTIFAVGDVKQSIYSFQGADPTGFIRDHSGALRSFGTHKGSGLAVMCEIMAAAVAGGQGAFDTPKGGILNSMLATVIDLSKLGDPAQIAADVQAVKAHVKSARPAPGFNEVLVPGEPERRYAEKRMRDGIEVDETTWRDIRAAAESIGISAAEFDQAAGANG